MTDRTLPIPIAITERRARFTPNERERFPYVELPFDVAPGTRAVEVRMTARDLAGAVEQPSIVDLGVFGPGPLDEHSFRGWSGGERSHIAFGEHAATPGYRPGPLSPGRWHALLGLYRVAPGGCEVELEISSFEAEADVADWPRVLPSAEASPETKDGSGRAAPMVEGWIPCDLHAHSHHSDGIETVPGLLRRAAAAGLGAIAITDHNTDSHIREARSRASGTLPLLLDGAEVTTYRGHCNAIGTARWTDFRIVDPDGMGRAIAEIHAHGGIVSINHPTDPSLGWKYGDGLDFDCVEVWNGPWSPDDDRAIEWWSTLLARDRRVVAIGGSDSHGPGQPDIGRPTTWVRANQGTSGAVLAAIRAGQVAITRDPGVRPPELSVTHDRRGAILRWRVWDAAGSRVLLLVDGVPSEAIPVGGPDVAGETPLRSGDWRLAWLEVRGPDGALVAFANPCWRIAPDEP